MTSAMQYLEKVTDRAKELYAISDQGEWDDLHPSLQRRWIDAADQEIKAENEGKRV